MIVAQPLSPLSNTIDDADVINPQDDGSSDSDDVKIKFEPKAEIDPILNEEEPMIVDSTEDDQQKSLETAE